MTTATSDGSTRATPSCRRAPGSAGRGTAASRGSRGPESVARTMTPIVTSPRAVARVSAASFWKRFTRRPFYPGGAHLRPTAIPCRAMTPRRWLPSSCSLRSPSSPPRAVRPPRRRAPAAVALGEPALRARDRDDAGWGPPGQTPPELPVLITNRSRRGQGAHPVLSTSTPNNAVERARTGPPRSPSTTSARTRHAGRRPPMARSSGRSRTSAACTSFDVDLPDAGNWGAEFTTAGAGRPAETVRRPRSRSARRCRPSAVGEPAPASKTPTAADVGGDLTKISTDAKPDPAFYQTSVADALAAPQAVHPRVRHAEVLRERAVRPDARSASSPIAAAHPEVTFINVEPYQLKDVDG